MLHNGITLTHTLPPCPSLAVPVVRGWRRAQTLMKARLAGAVKGHSLLKKKAEALQMRFRQILAKIVEVRGSCECKLVW